MRRRVMHSCVLVHVMVRLHCAWECMCTGL